MSELREVLINGKWPLRLLGHRAARPEWPTWEQERLILVHDLVEPGCVVWEIGAEEGDFPALYGTWGANVVAVEPNPYVWPQIRIHWTSNVDADQFLHPVVGLASDVTVDVETDYPTGWRNGWPEVAYWDVYPEHGFRHIGEHSGVSPQFRLDDLPLPTPDIVCMDIEGGELHALRGMEETLREHHPHVVCSIHPPFLRDLYGFSPMMVFDLMTSRGYRAAHVATDHEEHWWFS